MTKRYLFAIIAVVITILVIWRFMIHQPESSASDPKATMKKESKGGGRSQGNRQVAVRVAQAYLKTHAIYAPAIGTIDGELVAVQPKVSGQLMQIHFKEGAYVEKGQVLADIDNRQYASEVQQAKAKLQASQANLVQAQNDLRRSESLYQQQSISKQTYETQQTQVAQLRGSVESDKAAVRLAEIKLSDSHITAPVSGTISLQQVRVGNFVNASDAGVIAYIAKNKPAEVAFSLPSSFLPQVLTNWQQKKNTDVLLLSSDEGTPIAKGQLISVEQRIQKETGTFPLRAEIISTQNRLFANDFIRVRLQIDRVENAVTVPAHAVLFGKQGYFVWAVTAQEDKKQATRQAVVLGPRVGEEYIIQEGLKEGTFVVTDGVDQLTEGTALNIADNLSESSAP